MDLGELDLQFIAIYYKWQGPNSIPEHQVQLLKYAPICNQIFRETTSEGKPSIPSLGIKAHSSHDQFKPPREEKKIGHRSNKQLLHKLGKLLVNSGHIALMT